MQLSSGTWILFALAVAFVLIPAVILLVRDFRDIICARLYITSLQNGQHSEISGFSFSKSIRRFVSAYTVARDRIMLQSFGLEEHLADVRRSAGSIAGEVRALAGVLILCGLIITLMNLQSAVGGLRDTFSELAAQQVASTSGDDTAAKVVGGMGIVAGAASTAFSISFMMISSAAVLLLLGLLIRTWALHLANSFSGWAHESLAADLPIQTPLNVVAAEFRASSQALERLTTSFNEMTESFGALQGFADSMDRARSAIVKAMQQLPSHIRESVGTLSETFVNSVGEGLRNSSEHTHQILLIYGHQQQRIENIQAEVTAIRDFTAQVATATGRLEGMPERVADLTTTVQTQAELVKRFELIVAELAIRVEDLPVEGLKEHVEALVRITGQVDSNVLSIDKVGQRIADSTNLLRQLPELAREIRTAVRHEADNSEAFRSTVDDLGEYIRALPVVEIREGIAQLAVATDKVGDVHATAIEALSQITRHSAAFESAGAELRARLEGVLKCASQLAIEQEYIRTHADENAAKIVDRLSGLSERLQSEIRLLSENRSLDGIAHTLNKLSLEIGSILEGLPSRTHLMPENGSRVPESVPKNGEGA